MVPFPDGARAGWVSLLRPWDAQHRIGLVDQLIQLAASGPSWLERAATGVCLSSKTQPKPTAPACSAATPAPESDVLRYDYRPLYRTPVLIRYAPTQPCRNAERLAATLLTVPCHERVATDDLARIGAAWRG